MKVYEVMFQDEWNNITLLGFYKSLDDSIDDINEMINGVYDCRLLEKGEIKEYSSTFDTVFDTYLDFLHEEDDCNFENLMVRGFILDLDDDVANKLIKLSKKEKENDDTK